MNTEAWRWVFIVLALWAGIGSLMALATKDDPPPRWPLGAYACAPAVVVLLVVGLIGALIEWLWDSLKAPRRPGGPGSAV